MGRLLLAVILAGGAAALLATLAFDRPVEQTPPDTPPAPASSPADPAPPDSAVVDVLTAAPVARDPQVATARASTVERKTPDLPGRILEITIGPPPERPEPPPASFRFRVLDEAGQPWPRARLRVTGLRAGEAPDDASFEDRDQVTADSRAIVLWDPRGPRVWREVDFDRLLVSPAFTNRPSPITVRQPLRPGINDLGDVSVEKPPLLAAGLAVDATGKSMSDIQVTICADAAGVPRDRFRSRGLEDTTDGDGRFEFRARTAVPAFVLDIADSRHYLEEPVRVQKGASDVRLELKRGFELDGRIAVEPEFDPSWLSIVVLRPGTRDWVGRSDGPSRDNGRFGFEGLRPAVYDLEVRLLHEGLEPLARIPGVRAGGDTKPDPRLDPIDVRGRLSRFRISVVDEKTIPFQGATIVCTSRNAVVMPDFDERGEVGRWRVVTTLGAAVDVEVSARDRKTVTRQGLVRDETVVLRESDWIYARLEARPMPTLPDSAFSLQCITHGGRSTFDERGSATLRLGNPGTYTVSLALVETRDLGNVLPTSFFGGKTVASIEVTGDPEKDVFEIPVDPAEYRRILREYGR